MMLGSWTIEISHQVTRACQERGAQITKTPEVVEKKVELVLKKQGHSGDFGNERHLVT